MKTIAKIGILLAIIFGMRLTASAKDYEVETGGDSIVVNFGKGGRMVVIVKDASDLEELKAIDFDRLIAEMAVYIDSAKKSKNGVYVINTERGEFKIYSDEIEEEEDDSMVIEINKGIYIGKASKMDEWKEKRDTKRTHSLTDIYLGLNSYLEDGKIPSGTDSELRPLGSRYFEIDFKYNTRLGKEDGKFSLSYGLGFSWYNFMLDGNKRFAEMDNKIVFEEVTGRNGESFNLDKTKLVASYVTVPMMLMFKKDKFRFGMGGYVAYRLGSHTKVKYKDEDNDWTKDKDFGNFNLTNFRYGLQTEIGVKGLTLFGKYDLNNLFTSNSGMPEMNAFAFGIRI